MPPEILATVEELRQYIDAQKKARDEILKFSSANIHKVGDDVSAIHARLLSINQGMSGAAADVKRLKDDVMADLRNVEVGQKTKEIPAGLQYENTAPVVFFMGLIQKFERLVGEYDEQAKVLEKHLASSSGGEYARCSVASCGFLCSTMGDS